MVSQNITDGHTRYNIKDSDSQYIKLLKILWSKTKIKDTK